MLRQFLSILLVCLATFALFMQDANAARFGGGRSFGMSRSASSFTRAAPSPAFGQGFSRSSAYGQTGSTASRWFGPLAGLLTGGLLASLFMGHGIGNGIMMWLLVGGLFFVLLTLFRNKTQSAPTPQYQRDYQNQSNFAQDAAAQFMRNSGNANAYAQPQPAMNNFPLGFDVPTFVRESKVQFIRMQAAYDAKNLADIRQFTTPEVFAEIQMQLQERGNAENKTNVISVDAEVLDVETTTENVAGMNMQAMIASVRFSGMIQEDRDNVAKAFSEIWHFRKEVANSHWLVAGVQQA